MAAVYDRVTAAWRALFNEVFPNELFKGNFQYKVRSCDYAQQTADLDPVNVEIGLPALTKIPIRSPLMAVKLQAGEVCLVGFENYNPAYPYVAGLPSAGAGGLPIVRQGDQCWVELTLTPALVGAGPAAAPDPSGTFWVITTLPGGAPPFLLPVSGGKLKVFGIASTGSQKAKVR